MKYKQILLLLFSITIFISCDSKYEKAVIGTYEVIKYKTSNEIEDKEISDLELTIFQNKKFKICANKRVIIGKWTVHDDGDRILIEFIVDNKIAEGIVIEEEQVIIEMWNGENLFANNLTEIYLQKQKSSLE